MRKTKPTQQYFANMQMDSDVITGDMDIGDDSDDDDGGCSSLMIFFINGGFGDDSDSGDDSDDGSDIAEEILSKVDQIPVARNTGRTVSSLKSLCVAKICTTATARQYFIDEQADYLTLTMLSNTTFHSDLRNLEKCCQLLHNDSSTPHYTWFPFCQREDECLRVMGVMLALSAFRDNQAVQLLLHNLFDCYQRSMPHSRELYYGHAVAFDNLPKIADALVLQSRRILHVIGKVFEDVATSTLFRDRPLHKHCRSFLKKYIPSKYDDVVAAIAHRNVDFQND